MLLQPADVQSQVEVVLELVLEVAEACVAAAAGMRQGDPQRDRVRLLAVVTGCAC